MKTLIQSILSAIFISLFLVSPLAGLVFSFGGSAWLSSVVLSAGLLTLSVQALVRAREADGPPAPVS